MVNPIGPFHQAKQQVVVLGAFKADAKSANVLDELPPHHHQVAGVHVAEKELRRPVRLEVRFAARTRFVELVLIRVDHVGVRVRVQVPDNLRQRLWRQLVVVIEERDVFSRGQC